jgi:hypothetical protein
MKINAIKQDKGYILQCVPETETERKMLIFEKFIRARLAFDFRKPTDYTEVTEKIDELHGYCNNLK